MSCWQLWLHPHKEQCHGINTSVDWSVGQTDGQHTLQRLSRSNWFLLTFVSILIYIYIFFFLECGRNEGTEWERRRINSLTSPQGTEMSASNGRLYSERATACRLLAAGQCFLFSILNDSSSLYNRQKGQSLIDTCKPPPPSHKHTRSTERPCTPCTHTQSLQRILMHLFPF